MSTPASRGAPRSRLRSFVSARLSCAPLAPFLLTTALLERLADSHARIVHVASDLHYTAGRHRRPGWQVRHALESLGVLARHDEAGLDLDDLQLEHTPFNGMDAYARSKLAQVAFSNELARRVPAIRSNAVHPGNVNTRVARSSPISAALLRLGAPLLRTPAEGADTVVWCATAPELEDTSGRYFADRTAKPPAPICEDPAFCSAVWERSMALLHRDEST